MKKTAFILCIVLLIVYFPVFFSGKTWYFADNYALTVPQKLYAVDSIKRGVLPFWNPLVLSGLPFLADINNSMVYPWTVSFFLFSPAVALNITVLSHLFLTGLGMYALCRVLKQSPWQARIGAVAWMLSGHMVAVSNNVALLQSTAWLPWIFVLVVLALRDRSKKALALLPLVFVLEILGGHPQPPLYIGMVLAVYLLFAPYWKVWKRVVMFVVPAVVTLAMTAFLVFPFLQLSARSTRVHMTLNEVINGSLHPALLVHWFFPNIFDNADLRMVWGPEWGKLKQTDGYITLIGIIAVLLFTWRGKKTYEEKVLVYSALFSIFLALGKYVPGMEALYERVAILRLVRNPSAMIIVWSFAGAAVVGRSFEWFSQQKKLLLWLTRCILILPVVLGLLLVTREWWFDAGWNMLSTSAFHTLPRDSIIVHAILLSIFFTSLFFVLVMRVLEKKRVYWPLVFALIALDMWIAIKPTIFLAPSNVYDTRSEQAKFLSAQPKGYRYISVNDYLPYAGLFSYFHDVVTAPPFTTETRFTDIEKQSFEELLGRQHNLVADWGMAHNLSTIYGYETLVPANTAAYWKVNAEGSGINEVDRIPFTDSRMNEQGVRYILLDKRIYPENYLSKQYPWLKIVKSTSEFAILENSHALPIVHPRTPNKNVQVSAIDVRPNTVAFVVSAKITADLFIAETYFPGWRCRINGKECVLKEVNGGMSMTAEPGEYTVLLNFVPDNFPLYARISLLVTAGYAVWVFFVLRKKLL
ncbi:MAG TPA: hypothetical protein DCX25_03665 [Candidatus Pacebacteria bacterium]|nr:MAG: hypothetical protein UX00_C0008G0013 [Microgenomates group bacterium GW2011_GWB1_45_17]KKU23026.1 MAG: hypothetical protein UX35_C0012G0013 [Microgenomates group bacterium GW2011_GWA1_46_15]KKU24756.1 MAG: hypothetical protein UX36_C0001G0373 [Microgenomates group bacterium GW2011_GWC1_46_15]HAV15402.1 hypothetical protein [Candidatus Paceibacterota bacterium]HCR11539.1 hypothetical protein [Candidatus Paceibacterota bacterium]